MTAGVIGQRCWNHESREAVCRCPACGRSFCRECVSEHDARLLCASCLLEVSRARAPRPGVWRRFSGFWMLAAGFVLALVFFYAAGQGLIVIKDRMERTEWQRR
jgi:hypothetical protein